MEAWKIGAMQKLTATEFAAKKGISRQRVHQYIKGGRIKPTPEKIGKWYAIKPNARITQP